MRLEYPIPLLCKVFDVSKNGYFSWKTRSASQREQEKPRLELEIRAAHIRTRETFGPERLQDDLAELGVQTGVHRIKRICKKLGLRCKQHRKFKPTTNSKHNLSVAPNLLDQQFVMSRPNQAWVTDITYIPTGEGWLYLAGHKDLYTGEVVGYTMSERMTRNLVIQSLCNAVLSKSPAPGLIHHSDRGSQCCSAEYRELVIKFEMRAFMSGKGSCYDNAPMESF